MFPRSSEMSLYSSKTLHFFFLQATSVKKEKSVPEVGVSEERVCCKIASSEFSRW